MTATYALIGHEMAATEDITKAMFSDSTKEKYPDLNERMHAYAAHAENGAEI